MVISASWFLSSLNGPYLHDVEGRRMLVSTEPICDVCSSFCGSVSQSLGASRVPSM